MWDIDTLCATFYILWSSKKWEKQSKNSFYWPGEGNIWATCHEMLVYQQKQQVFSWHSAFILLLLGQWSFKAVPNNPTMCVNYLGAGVGLHNCTAWIYSLINQIGNILWHATCLTFTQKPMRCFCFVWPNWVIPIITFGLPFHIK